MKTLAEVARYVRDQASLEAEHGDDIMAAKLRGTALQLENGSLPDLDDRLYKVVGDAFLLEGFSSPEKYFAQSAIPT